MASTSSSSVASGSAAQHTDIDVDVEEDGRSSAATETVDEDMSGDAAPVAEGTQAPQSVSDAEPRDSELAASFYHNDGDKKRQGGSRPAAVVVDDDDDGLLEPELPGREERLLDEKIRARYIQEIGDIF